MTCCNKCKSDRMICVDAKWSDCFSATSSKKEHNGYVPYDIGIGGGNYIFINYCLNCGQIQGNWPLPKSKIE